MHTAIDAGKSLHGLFALATGLTDAQEHEILKRLGEKGGEALQAVPEEDRDELKDTDRVLHYENWTK